MERAERLWPGGPRYIYDEQCFPPSTDSFLLGSFASLRRGERVCDLGAGAGLLGLLLLAREPTLTVTGIERDAHACEMLAHNAAANCLVYRPERLAALMAAAAAHGLEPKRLRMVQHTAQSAPSLLLLECRRGGKPGLSVEPPLLLRLPDGSEAPDVRRAYFRDKE